MAVSAHAQAQY